MTSRLPLLFAASALALASSPALAQHGGHDHGAMHGDQHGASTQTSGVAEGKLVKGVRTFELAVTEDGFVPSRVKVKKGEKALFLVTRKTDSTCAKEIVIKDFGINAPLPLNEVVRVEFTPGRSGEVRYACGMDHVSGVVFVP
jgi:plastocyanin domain-containing protein